MLLRDVEHRLVGHAHADGAGHRISRRVRQLDRHRRRFAGPVRFFVRLGRHIQSLVRVIIINRIFLHGIDMPPVKIGARNDNVGQEAFLHC